MGYEMGFCRAGMRDSEFDLDQIYWWSCGWNKTDLHRAIACLVDGSYPNDCYSTVRIPVEKLGFIHTISEQVKANPILEWADRLGSLDEGWRDDFLEGLSPEIRAACRISYTLEGLNENELEVVAKIAELAEYYDFDVRGLGDVIADLQAKGIEEVDLFGS